MKQFAAWLLVMTLLLGGGVSLAEQIQLRQSDGSVEPMGGIGATAKMTPFSGATITAKSDVSVTSSATLVSASSATRLALNCTNTSASVAVRWGGGRNASRELTGVCAADG